MMKPKKKRKEISLFDTGKYSLEDQLQASLHVIGLQSPLLPAFGYKTVVKHIADGNRSRNTQPPVRVLSGKPQCLRDGRFLTLEIDLVEKETVLITTIKALMK
jgi:hypothetical protein